MTGRPATRYVALIRAVNVRGHQSLKMEAVRATFTTAGCENVRTCLQSGNIVFEYPRASRAAVRQKIRTVFLERFAVEPYFVLRTGPEIERLVSSEPFRGIASAGPRVKLYVTFLFRKPRRTPKLPFESTGERLTAVSTINREVFLVSRLKPNGFFGFPNNFIEDAFGVPATTRNWSTVIKIMMVVRSDRAIIE